METNFIVNRILFLFRLLLLLIIIIWISFVDTIKQPCTPSPCGPNSICKVVSGHAVCSCQPGLIGSPPTCKPECVVSADCPLTQACLNNKCQDPCPGTCGQNTNCQVVNHNPICSCSESYTGDPFTICYPQPSKSLIIEIIKLIIEEAIIKLINFIFCNWIYQLQTIHDYKK